MARDESALGLGLAGTIMLAVGRLAATGRLPRNRFAGIRIPSTMRSDEAWRAGHRAGAPALTAAAVGPLASAVILATANPKSDARSALKALDTAWVLGLLGLATVKASHAARATHR